MVAGTKKAKGSTLCDGGGGGGGGHNGGDGGNDGNNGNVMVEATIAK